MQQKVRVTCIDEPLPPIESYESRGEQSVKAEPETRFRTVIEANQWLRAGNMGDGFTMDAIYCEPALYVVRRYGMVCGVGVTPDVAIADAESNLVVELYKDRGE